jgi:hypothetical protein
VITILCVTCLRLYRDFLQVLTIEPSSPSTHVNDASLGLEYDIEWLAILRKTHALLSCSQGRVTLPEHFSVPSKEVIITFIRVT